MKVRMTKPPHDDEHLADDVRGGHGAPCPAVIRLCTAVTHHEVVACRDLRERNVVGRLAHTPVSAGNHGSLSTLPSMRTVAPREEIVSPGRPITRFTRIGVELCWSAGTL